MHSKGRFQVCRRRKGSVVAKGHGKEKRVAVLLDWTL